MSSAPEPASETAAVQKPKRRSPLHFLWRGLAISLPPILTLVILIWIGQILNVYILKPTTGAVKFVIAQFTDESRPADQFTSPDTGFPPLDFVDRKYVVSPKVREEARKLRTDFQQRNQPKEQVDEQVAAFLKKKAYVELPDQRAVPYEDYAEVARRLRPSEIPRTARGIYMELATTRYFQSLFHLSVVAILIALLLLYFLGRLVTVRMGAWTVHKFESGVMARLPLISRVYSSVKQVTDFFFTERTVEYNRVVAVEYPRRGTWSLGFVTSDSFLEITAAAGEPLVTVLMPTSPMPMTGFTISVPRSEVIDLNVTVDQAFQFCLSCGVLVPEHQKVTPELLGEAISNRLNLSESAPEQSETETIPSNGSPSEDAEATRSEATS